MSRRDRQSPPPQHDPGPASDSERNPPNPGARFEDPLVGKEILGRYTVEKEIGHGGMGHVFRAWDNAFNEACAVKVVHAEHGARLAREFVAGRRLRNLPGVPGLRDRGTLADGRHFLVFDCCEGRTLSAWLVEDGRLSLPDVLDLGIAVAEIMEAAHRRGVIHRDLSPRNLIIEEDDVWVIDFGLSCIADEPRLTAQGAILGTWPYLAPEQLQSPDTVDGRADVCSLAMILYRALAGREAMPELAEVDRRDVIAMIAALMRKRHLRALVPELPLRLADAIMRGADPVSTRRFGSMAEFAAELRACKEESQRRGEVAPKEERVAEERPQRVAGRRRWWIGGAAATVVAAVAVLVVMLARDAREERNAEREHVPVIAPVIPALAPSPEPHPPLRTIPPVRDHEIDSSSALGRRRAARSAREALQIHKMSWNNR